MDLYHIQRKHKYSAPSGHERHSLSKEFEEIAELCGRGPVTLALIFEQIRERSHALMTLFLAAPFILPIPLPGVSIPFGLLIILFGCAIATGWDPYLPRRLIQKPLPPDKVQRLSLSSARFFRRCEKYLKPRLNWAIANRFLHTVAGIFIALAGLLLALPLPPGTNAPPAITILLLSAALLERDGLVLFLGIGAFVLNIVFFATLGFVGFEAFTHFFPL